MTFFVTCFIFVVKFSIIYVIINIFTTSIGAHTLGRAHREASGFTGPWVQRQDRLDNAFYIDLNNQSMNWVQRQNGRGGENLWSWVRH